MKPAHFVTSGVMALALASGPALAQTSSPFQPPEEELGVYVVDSGPGLDTGCTFRSGGPLLINLEVPAVVNDEQLNFDGTLKDPADLVRKGVIGQRAVISFPVFDIDSSANVSGIAPEVDVVSFNGVRKDTLTGSNNRWTNDTIEIDIGEIKFGDANELRIDIDTANTQESWCMAVDWVAIEFDVARPYVLAHGINANRGSWENGVTDFLDEFGVKYDYFTVGENARVAQNAVELENEISRLLEPLKADQVHLIAHSKGGLDSQALQAIGPDFEILSLSTLSTPHLGSAIADIETERLAAAGELRNIGVDPNGRIQDYLDAVSAWYVPAFVLPELPGIRDLTTASASTAIAARLRGNIRRTFAIGADADLNNNQQLDDNEDLTNFSSGDQYTWEILRRVRSFNIGQRTQQVNGQPVTVITYQAVLSTTPLENDVVVTTQSALPNYATRVLIDDANHSTVVDEQNVERFLLRTIGLR